METARDALWNLMQTGGEAKLLPEIGEAGLQGTWFAVDTGEAAYEFGAPQSEVEKNAGESREKESWTPYEISDQASGNKELVVKSGRGLYPVDSQGERSLRWLLALSPGGYSLEDRERKKFVRLSEFSAGQVVPCQECLLPVSLSEAMEQYFAVMVRAAPDGKPSADLGDWLEKQEVPFWQSRDGYAMKGLLLRRCRNMAAVIGLLAGR